MTEPSRRSPRHKEVIIHLRHMGHRLIHRARKDDRQLGHGIATITPGRAAGWAVARIPGTQKVLATLETSGFATAWSAREIHAAKCSV